MVPKRLRGPAPVTRLISIVLLVATGLALAEGLNQEPFEDAVLPAEFRWLSGRTAFCSQSNSRCDSTELDVHRHVLWAEQTTAALQ